MISLTGVMMRPVVALPRLRSPVTDLGLPSYLPYAKRGPQRQSGGRRISASVAPTLCARLGINSGFALLLCRSYAQTIPSELGTCGNTRFTAPLPSSLGEAVAITIAWARVAMVYAPG